MCDVCACYFIFVYLYRELAYRLFIWINSSMILCVFSDIFIVTFTYLSPSVFTSLLLAKDPSFPIFPLGSLVSCYFPLPTFCTYLLHHSFVGLVDWSHCVLAGLLGHDTVVKGKVLESGFL